MGLINRGWSDKEGEGGVRTNLCTVLCLMPKIPGQQALHDRRRALSPRKKRLSGCQKGSLFEGSLFKGNQSQKPHLSGGASIFVQSLSKTPALFFPAAAQDGAQNGIEGDLVGDHLPWEAQQEMPRHFGFTLLETMEVTSERVDQKHNPTFHSRLKRSKLPTQIQEHPKGFAEGQKGKVGSWMGGLPKIPASKYHPRKLTSN